MPSLARIREIYCQNNHDMEQKGVKALDEVKERLADIPSLMEEATVEVENFDMIVEATGDTLDDLYQSETEAAQRLFLWSGQ